MGQRLKGLDGKTYTVSSLAGWLNLSLTCMSLSVVTYIPSVYEVLAMYNITDTFTACVCVCARHIHTHTHML